MEQIEDLNTHHYKEILIGKIEEALSLVFVEYWKPELWNGIKIENSEIVKGPRLKLNINKKRD